MTTSDAPFPEPLRRAAIAFLSSVDPVERRGELASNGPSQEVEAELANALRDWLESEPESRVAPLIGVSGDILALLHSTSEDLVKALLARVFADGERRAHFEGLCRNAAAKQGLPLTHSSMTGDIAAGMLEKLSSRRTFFAEADFEAYLTRSIMHRMVDQSRSSGVARRGSDGEAINAVPDPAKSPVQQADDKEAAVNVIAATRRRIATYEREEQPMLVMAFLEQWPVPDLVSAFPRVPKVEGGPIPTVRAHEARIRRKLKKFMTDLRGDFDGGGKA